jgi:hypothetical protein
VDFYNLMYIAKPYLGILVLNVVVVTYTSEILIATLQVLLIVDNYVIQGCVAKTYMKICRQFI